MDVFAFRNHLVRDYSAYINSFIHIQEPRIKDYVQRSLDEGVLWPEPLIQLNPAFEPGDCIDDLVDQNVLHPECRLIFQRDSKRSVGHLEPWQLADRLKMTDECHSTSRSFRCSV